MPIIRQKTWYTVEDCRAHPDRLYVFGDNLAEVGKGGQAIIRDEPNAVGLPTKNTPDTDETAYFTNADYTNPALVDAWLNASRTLGAHLNAGHDVVIPADGIGTGRAELATRAPLILEFVNALISELEETYGVKQED